MLRGFIMVAINSLIYSRAGAASPLGSFAIFLRAELKRSGGKQVCKVKATFFEHYAACQPFVALSQQKKERSNDFQPKFDVLCEFLSVLVLQVGVIQDNVGFAESLLCLPFVLFFLFVVVFFFLVPSCKSCYRVAHVLPRNPIGFVMKKKT